MSTAFIKLKDRTITDRGEVVVGYDTLVELARDGLDFHSLLTHEDDRIRTYNRLSKRKLSVWKDDGDLQGPADDCYEWNTPEPFRSMDIIQLCWKELKARGLDDDRYRSRLEIELSEMEKRGMFPVIRHLLFLVNDFRRRKVVWGVGRGSSCASLVLFLIGLNKVDPVLYDIPMDEFLRP